MISICSFESYFNQRGSVLLVSVVRRAVRVPIRSTEVDVEMVQDAETQAIAVAAQE